MRYAPPSQRCSLHSLIPIMIFSFVVTQVNAVHAQEASAKGTTSDTATLSIEQHEHSLNVFKNGQLLTTYHDGHDSPKPYFNPVIIPEADIELTRPLKAQLDNGKYPPGYDHPWHRGIWIAVDHLDHLDHWTEKHRIKNSTLTIDNASGASVQFTVHNAWLNAEQSPVLNERTVITFYSDGLIEFNIHLTPVAKEIMIGDTKEGFLAFRLADDLRGTASGLITNAYGKTGEKESWGKVSPWIDYAGSRDGKTVGVALFDDPNNFRSARYHVRDYGLFAISPFGPGTYTSGKQPQQPVIVTQKSPVHLRYGIYLHQGSTENADIPGAYKHFLELQQVNTTVK